MNELLINYTPQQILVVVHQIINDYKITLLAIQDLYARITKTNDPNEILAGISKIDLELVPALRQLIGNPDDKYWHANLLTLVISEIYRLQDIWEWLDCEFSEIPENYQTNITDKLLGLYHSELLISIQKRLTTG
jgi:hypothetical protein